METYSLRARSEFSQAREIQLRVSRSDTRPSLQRCPPTSPRTPQGGKARGKGEQANEASLDLFGGQPRKRMATFMFQERLLESLTSGIQG